MILIGEYKPLTMFNVQEAVYEILDVSGFTSLMEVDRALKTVSTDGCRLIGRGQNGSVYRYSPDTVVKVYSERNKLEDVRRENQMSRLLCRRKRAEPPCACRMRCAAIRSSRSRS